jgi:hypothetical protein
MRSSGSSFEDDCSLYRAKKPWLIGPDAVWFAPYNGLRLRLPSENFSLPPVRIGCTLTVERWTEVGHFAAWEQAAAFI